MKSNQPQRRPIQLPDDRKLALLNEHLLTGPAWESLEDTRWCLHCEKTFDGRAVCVYEDAGFDDGYSLECGTPGCDGSPIDWHEPNGDFARGVMAQSAETAARGLTDRQAGEAEEANPDDEDCGTYGPELEVSPQYEDAAQRRLRPLLWQEAATPQGKARGSAAFLKVLRDAARAGLAQAFAAALGAATIEKARLSFPARASAYGGDEEDGTLESFLVEVEYLTDAQPGSEEDSDGFDDQLYHLINRDETSDALLGELRLAIANYLATHGAADEALAWNLEVTGYGG